MKPAPLRLALAAWAGLFAAINGAFAQDWVLTGAPMTNWVSLASSADGSSLFAAAGGKDGKGFIYSSADSGRTWEPTLAPATNWTSVACSAFGSNLVAACWGAVYVSSDFGRSWTGSSEPGSFWLLARSADGTRIVRTTDDSPFLALGSIHVSTNNGATWDNAAVGSYGPWLSVAASAAGDKFVAVGWYPRPGGFVPSSCLSTNWGATWQYLPLEDLGSWGCVACSAEGNKLIAGAQGALYGNPVYVSSDTGVTWTQTGAPMAEWASVASSATGQSLVSASSDGFIYTSVDSGKTWISNSAPVADWSAVASSADGSKLVATVNGGGIYTWQTTPHPAVNVSPSGTNLVLSWIIPSQPFVLQNNADLSPANWTDGTNVPVLNVTNLQHQVTLPLPASNGFYRLKSTVN
jgi:hypothetical protein